MDLGRILSSLELVLTAGPVGRVRGVDSALSGLNESDGVLNAEIARGREERT